jgi:ADP-ribose pyrophosphatase
VTAGVDAPHDYAVLARHERFTGPMFSIVTDDVAMPGGRVAARDYMRHVGAVAAVALDDEGRVVLVRQYRHPVRRFLWELPAGLVDVAGEPAAATAARELAEEADLLADRWDLLLDLHSTPGCSNELIRVFLARGLRPVPEHELHVRHDEEAELTTRRLDLDEAVGMIFRGEITNGPCIAGLLAAARARDNGWAGLRPPDTAAPSAA